MSSSLSHHHNILCYLSSSSQPYMATITQLPPLSELLFSLASIHSFILWLSLARCSHWKIYIPLSLDRSFNFGSFWLTISQFPIISIVMPHFLKSWCTFFAHITCVFLLSWEMRFFLLLLMISFFYGVHRKQFPFSLFWSRFLQNFGTRQTWFLFSYKV